MLLFLCVGSFANMKKLSSYQWTPPTRRDYAGAAARRHSAMTAEARRRNFCVRASSATEAAVQTGIMLSLGVIALFAVWIAKARGVDVPLWVAIGPATFFLGVGVLANCHYRVVLDKESGDLLCQTVLLGQVLTCRRRPVVDYCAVEVTTHAHTTTRRGTAGVYRVKEHTTSIRFRVTLQAKAGPEAELSLRDALLYEDAMDLAQYAVAHTALPLRTEHLPAQVDSMSNLLNTMKQFGR